MGFLDSGIPQGLNQASDTLLRTGMGMMHYNQNKLIQDQAMKIRQEQADREKIAFERQESAIQEQDARYNAVVPASKYFSKIREFPSYRQSLIEGFKALNLPYEETPDGDVIGKYGHGMEVMKWIYASGERAEKQAKGVFGDLQNKKMTLLEQLPTVKKPEEAKAIQDQIAQISEQQAQVIGSTWDVQKKMAEESAKAPTGTPSSNSVTERGGFPIWKDPRNQSSTVVKPDGTREVYNPAVHGKELSQNLSQTNIYNQNQKDAVGFKTWTPEAKQQEFMEHMITGTPPVNTRGLAGADRQAYAKEFAQWKVDKGFTPQMASALKSDYKANDMSLKNMTKQEAPMSAFVLNINRQIAKVEQLYSKNDRTGLRLLDVPIRELRVRAKGSGDEAVKSSYLLEISNEIGKLSSGASGSVQQLSDSAKEDWKKVHDANLSMKEIMKVVNATRDQANMRISTWREAKEEVRRTMQFLGTENSNYQPFDVTLPAGIKAEDIAAELERRRKK